MEKANEPPVLHNFSLLLTEKMMIAVAPQKKILLGALFRPKNRTKIFVLSLCLLDPVRFFHTALFTGVAKDVQVLQ